MIRHMVLVRFRADLGSDDIEAIFSELAGLRKVLAGMLNFTAGPNISAEGLGRGYGHAFTCDFKDAAARDAYLTHPAHRAAGARLVAATEGGADGLVVVDVNLLSAAPPHRQGGSE